MDGFSDAKFLEGRLKEAISHEVKVAMAKRGIDQFAKLGRGVGWKSQKIYNQLNGHLTLRGLAEILAFLDCEVVVRLKEE